VNVLAFVPAVVSSAAGLYALTLLADAGVDADLPLRPGQVSHDAGAHAVPPFSPTARCAV
jgi:hypothetical protein